MTISSRSSAGFERRDAAFFFVRGAAEREADAFFRAGFRAGFLAEGFFLANEVRWAGPRAWRGLRIVGRDGAAPASAREPRS